MSPHLHISVVYSVQADENEQAVIKSDENSAVRWIPIREIDIYLSESHMKKVYNKIISKIENYRYKL